MMQKCRKIELCYIYQGEFINFQILQKEVNNKPLYKHKKGFARYDV